MSRLGPTVVSPTFVPVSDHAVLVEFATEFDSAIHDEVLALDRRIASHLPAHVVEVVPALINLLVLFDPMNTDHDTIEAALRLLLEEPAGTAAPSRLHRIEVCYHESVAPDLEGVADACGLSIDAAIEAHLAGNYRVLMYGFAPGYAYLGGVPPELRVPRKAAAVRGVIAGSVIIADHQCLITTVAMPTGWSVIGRSNAEILPEDPERPLLVDPGDTVEFVRVDLSTFEHGAR